MAVEGKGGVLDHHPPQNSPKTPKTAKTPKGPPLPENAFSPKNANFQKVGRQTPKTPLQTQSWAPTSKCLNDLTKSQWIPRPFYFPPWLEKHKDGGVYS
eukprot:SAG11_NODE_1833_length_4189_cov_20.714914_1_plen_99_part_00